MKKLWQKWSYEIPLAIGDALWEVLVVQFAAFLDRLTIRKVVEFVAIALLVMAFAQTLPFDLAILFAGDILTYLEFVIALRLAAGVMHVRAILNQVTRFARLVLRALNAAVRLPALTFTRLRERRTAAASKPRRLSDASDNDGGAIAWGALAPA
ncbi:hypothetical protein [Afipia sp. GAS231]|uniref:hypothetical protein n=1 Tax=Afipia sp. GAS231 TaxID=1882747 RepID=UPI00087A22F6|nr:hypothetical protein [Afipia sp. GAS231]SDN31502.1 hypothetical protein SAMN05444050_1249 [Afipia sp. GAS231]